MKKERGGGGGGWGRPRASRKRCGNGGCRFIGEVIVPVRLYGERDNHQGEITRGEIIQGRDHTGRESIICGRERSISAQVHMGRRS